MRFIGESWPTSRQIRRGNDLAVGALYLLTGMRMGKHYDAAARPIVVPTDSGALARGKHLVAAIGSWTADEFIHARRTGMRPNTTQSIRWQSPGSWAGNCRIWRSRRSGRF